MGYEAMIERLINTTYCKHKNSYTCPVCLDAATAIETLLAEMEAAVRDLTEFCKENPDSCHLCKHFPCAEKYERCIGWEWRGYNPQN